MREGTGGSHSDGSIVISDGTLIAIFVGIVAFGVGFLIGKMVGII